MEKVETQNVTSNTKIEEFLGYDDRGNPVVLRRSIPQHMEDKAGASNYQASSKQASEGRPTGSMRFFAGFEEVKARLQAKMAAS